jgi:hypothetical protein
MNPKSMNAHMRKEEARWRADDALRTLMRATEIRKDKMLMKHVRMLAKEQLENLKGVK